MTQRIIFLSVRISRCQAIRRADTVGTMDPLADVLDVSRVRGALLANVRAHAPWGLALPQSTGASFHALTSGTAWLRVAGADPLQLMPGDLLLLPDGHPAPPLLDAGRALPSVRPRDEAAADDRRRRSAARRPGRGHDVRLRGLRLRPRGRAAAALAAAACAASARRSGRRREDHRGRRAAGRRARRARRRGPGRRRAADRPAADPRRADLERRRRPARLLAARAARPACRPRPRAAARPPERAVDDRVASPPRCTSRARRSRAASPSSSASRR